METDKTIHPWAIYIAQNRFCTELYDKTPEEAFLIIGYTIVEMLQHFSNEEIDCSDWREIMEEAVEMKFNKIPKDYL